MCIMVKKGWSKNKGNSRKHRDAQLPVFCGIKLQKYKNGGAKLADCGLRLAKERGLFNLHVLF